MANYRRFTIVLITLASLEVLAEETQAPAAPVPPKAPLSSDLLKSGNVIGYGFTVGAGLSLSGYSLHGPGVAQTLPAAMPYIAVFPFAWLVHGDVTKAYCSARFLSGEEAAQTHADATATYRAQVAYGKPVVSDEEVKKETGWQRRTAGRCGIYTKLGLYVGKPSGFKANSDINGIVKARSFTSYASVGLISAPVSFFSAFVGVSFWSVEDGDAGINRNAATLTAGLGTNVDILSLLIK